MKFLVMVGMMVCMAFATQTIAGRINQEGRILDSLPAVTNAVLFNTTNADATVAEMQIFPVTNPWNERISNLPLLTNSDAMIAQINSDAGSSHRRLVLFQEMNYVLVPDTQPRLPIGFFNYPDESDLDGGTGTNGAYPIPVNLPIETWPTGTGNQSLTQWQTNTGGDRHAIMVAPGSGYIWETWETSLSGTNWIASNGAKFNLNSNDLRTDTWTSGDAAGLPMFPALVRYDECERGMVEHACRLVVVHTRAAHIYPATHNTTGYTGVNYPAMGQRLRLKAGFAIPSNWTKEEKALLLGLKKYGCMVADNSSSFFSISITPDDRWPANAWSHISSPGVAITNFEVVQTTGINEGPRSPGAPVAIAGPGQAVAVGSPLTLGGFVLFSNTPPVIQWTRYSGPGTVTFGNAGQTNTTAVFSTPGVYTLELSADDPIHAVAYDAVVITVFNPITVSIKESGTNVNLAWTGGSPPFVLQQNDILQSGLWNNVLTTSLLSASIPMTNQTRFFRIQGQ